MPCVPYRHWTRQLAPSRQLPVTTSLLSVPRPLTRHASRPHRVHSSHLVLLSAGPGDGSSAFETRVPISPSRHDHWHLPRHRSSVVTPIPHPLIAPSRSLSNLYSSSRSPSCPSAALIRLLRPCISFPNHCYHHNCCRWYMPSSATRRRHPWTPITLNLRSSRARQASLFISISTPPCAH